MAGLQIPLELSKEGFYTPYSLLQALAMSRSPFFLCLCSVGLILIPQLALALDSDALEHARPIERLVTVSDSGAGERDAARVESAETLFGDRFELEFSAPDLVGELRLSNKSYFSPSPRGTTLKSLSPELVAQNGPSYLQGDTSYIGQIDPLPETYVNRVDFQRLNHSFGGLVEAAVTAVDLSLNDPASSTSGCEAGDFGSFPAGDIALIQRGGCGLEQKARHAGEAGASAVIIFNQGTPDRLALFAGTLAPDYERIEPVVAVSFAQGSDWATLAAGGRLVLVINVEEGTAASAWELKPLPFNNADAQGFWLTNVDSNKSLFSTGETLLNGTAVHEVSLGDVDPNDARGWWFVKKDQETGATLLQNFDTNEFLAAVVDGPNVYLITATNFALRTELCPPDSNCDNWEVAEPIRPPPSGAARIRSALGSFYLQLNDVDVEAERIKSGWEQALWILEVEPGTGYRRLKNVVSEGFVHVQNGPVEVGEISPGWWSAMWTLEPTGNISQINTPFGDGAVARDFPLTNAQGYYLIRNRWTNQVLARRNGVLQAVSGPTDTLDAIWVIEDQNVPIIDSNLRAVINGYLAQAAGAAIRSSEAAGLYTLFGGGSNISDLSGLEYFFNLRDLRLANNPFTDITPIASLVQLEKLNLVQSAITNIDALLNNEGLGLNDQVLLTRSALGWDDRETGRLFRDKNIVSVPYPGEIALHKVGTRRVVEARNLELVDFANADSTASWQLEYDPAGNHYYLTAGRGTAKRYLYYIQDDTFIWDDNIPRNNSGEFEIHITGISGQYKLYHTGADRYLHECFGKMEINRTDPECLEPGAELSFYISDQYISDVQQAGLANYYDPNFAPPSDGYTRIQNTRTRTFLSAGSGSSVNLAEVGEFQSNAQWKLIPLQLADKYLFVVRNRQYPSGYLYRASDGTLGLGALPGSQPDGAAWANDSANKPFVFDLAGNTLGTFNIQPIQAPDSRLRDSSSSLFFTEQLSNRSYWRFDGGVAVAEVASKVVVLQKPTDVLLSLWEPSFAIRWLEPESRYGTQMVEKSFQGEGIYEIPVTAREVRILISCSTCGFAWESERERSEVVEFYDWDRPQDACYETRGDTFNPYVTQCDPAEGQLALLAEDLVEEYACPLEVMINFAVEAYDTVGMDAVGKMLVNQDIDGAKQRLVDMGNLGGPDFSNCELPFRSASFGAGGQAGLFNAEETGELGLTWNLLPDSDGPPIWSYSSLAREINPQARLFTLEYQNIHGWWVGFAEDLRGRAVGLTLNANQMKTMPTRVAFVASKLTKIAGPSANITVWLACGSGAGSVIYDGLCTVREDSDFIGVTLDLSLGTDLSLPKVRGIGLSYGETCVPAGLNNLGDCPR